MYCSGRPDVQIIGTCRTPDTAAQLRKSISQSTNQSIKHHQLFYLINTLVYIIEVLPIYQVKRIFVNQPITVDHEIEICYLKVAIGHNFQFILIILQKHQLCHIPE